MLQKPNTLAVSLTTACQKTEQGQRQRRWVVEVYPEAGLLHSFLALGLAPPPASRLVPCQDTAQWWQGPDPTDPKELPGLAAAPPTSEPAGKGEHS